jgi:16S rRNA (guanine966-N2)-methyltransferase
VRIIAGKFRGHTLVSPPGEKTRPITDRAKQSLFDALQECFVDATVMDCFAGTGSMGLECLSRGAAKAVFIERDRGALKGLKQNIADMGFGDKAVVLPIDAYAAAANHPDVCGLTIAFVDPPYVHATSGHERHKLDALIRELAEKAMVDGGIISFRHPTNVSVDGAAMGVKVVREFRYGDMGITWLTKG